VTSSLPSDHGTDHTRACLSMICSELLLDDDELGRYGTLGNWFTDYGVLVMEAAGAIDGASEPFTYDSGVFWVPGQLQDAGGLTLR
jgi:hypothetical protein